MALLCLLALAGAGEAAPCKPGETVTLEGEYIIPPVQDDGEWFWPGRYARTPCEVMTLRGKGALPADCRVGQRVTLSGRVRDDGVLTLHAEQVRCY